MRYLSILALLSFFTATVLAKDPVILYLAGDSTMAQKQSDKRPETGWGEFLQEFFKEDKVRVENHAKNGRSTRTFIEEKLWQEIVEKLTPGDFVFIQFGHNDQPKEKASHTSPEEFRRNLIKFVSDVREKKATPVLLTPVVRRRFDESGKFYDTHAEYPDIVRSVATEQKVSLIDMQRKSEEVVSEFGMEKSKKLFLHLKPKENPNYPNGIEDNTHFSQLGALVMAALAVEGIHEEKLKLANWLKKTESEKARK